MRSSIGRSSRFRIRPMVAVAVGGSFAAIRTAPGAIVYSGPVDETLNLNEPGGGYGVALEADGVDEVRFITASVSQSKDGIDYLGIEDYEDGFMPIGKQEKGSTNYEADALAAGTAIDGVQPFISVSPADLYISSTNIQGAWSPGLDAYVGFEFTSPYDSQTHYGWIEVAVSSDGTEGTIEDWAWDDVPNETIDAGQVPEPATGALLAFCAGGVFLRRRR
jgi:hypothetical protein